MNDQDKRVAEKLANEHWGWFQEIVGQIVRDFFIHGYKHGKDNLSSKVGVMNEQEYEEFSKQIRKCKR